MKFLQNTILNRYLIRWVWQPVGYLLLLLLFCRIFFTCYNVKYLSVSDKKEVVWMCVYGLRYDLIVTFLLMLPWLLVFYVANRFQWKRTRLVLLYLYLLLIAGVAVLGIADAIYYHFNLHRLRLYDVTIIIDNLGLGHSVMGQYWYLIVAVVFVVWGGYYMIKRIVMLPGKSLLVRQSPAAVLLCCGATLSVLLYDSNTRHWFTSSSSYFITQSGNVPFVTNAPIEFLMSFKYQESSIKRYTFMPNEKALQLYPVVHQLNRKVPTQKNVLLFIIESASQEDFVAGYQRRHTMPFLDSLMGHSLVYDHFFANGLASPAGFDAIIGGLPSCDAEDFFHSGHGYNKTQWFTQVLRQQGYNTSFYYGIRSLSYSFMKTAKNFQFEHDFGYRHFNAEPGSFDHNYGIYDHAFFPAVAKNMESIKPPFFAALYNVSTHYPFNLLPPAIADTLPSFEKSNGKAMRYYDNVLRDFFRQIIRQQWYQHTVFIFVADHFSRADDNINKSPVGIFRIPMFIFDPSNKELAGVCDQPAQQLDLPITILDLLGISTSFFSYGRSLYDTSGSHFCHNKVGNVAQLINKEHVLRYDLNNKKVLGYYQYVEDPALIHDLYPEKRLEADSLVPHVQAFWQVVGETANENKMVPSAFH